MERRRLSSLSILGILLTVGACFFMAMISSSFAQNSKKSKGLNFAVPEDWPIEKRGGIVGPIPTEEYITIKFKATAEEIRSIKDNLEERVERLNEKLDMLDEKRLDNNILQPQNSVPSEIDDDQLTEVLAMLDKLEAKIGRLDRKITNKIAEMRKIYEQKTLSITLFDKSLKDLKKKIFKLQGDVDYLLEQ